MSDLSYFTIMARNSRGKATAQVVDEALSSPKVFVFGELVSLDEVKALADDPETKKVHELLMIFTNGTYMDYKQCKEASGLPALTPQQEHKLKQLTIVTLASKVRNLSYDELQVALDLPDVRVLEDVVIDAITNNLLQAKLDQASRSVEVIDVVGRDVRTADIDTMLATLDSWHTSSGNVMEELDSIIRKVKASEADNIKHEKLLLKKIEAQQANVKAELAKSGDMSTVTDMELALSGILDEDLGVGRKKSN